MKFSATLAALAAPLAMAKAVHNVYPSKRDTDLYPRKSEEKSERGRGGGSQAQAGGATVLTSLQGPGQQISASQAELLSLGLAGAGITTNAATEVIIVWVNQGNGAPTMNVNPPAAPPPAAAPPAEAPPAGAPPAEAPPAGAAPPPPPAGAQTHEVMVGGAAGLQFTPSEITAAVGDMVVFTFMSANHTATQSAFDTPCQALAGGMDSGFQANPNNSVNPPPQVAMQVMVDTPLWFYCKQKGHCGKGMTFSINPTAAKTQAMFQSMAIAQNGTGAGTAITGGQAPPPAAAGGNGSAAAAPPAEGGAAAPPAEGGAAGGAAAGGAAEGGSGGSGGSATGGAAEGGSAGGVTPTMGQGAIENGACVCAVTCSTGSFPAAQAQGVGAFGGVPGALPASMSEVMMNAAAA